MCVIVVLLLDKCRFYFVENISLPLLNYHVHVFGLMINVQNIANSVPNLYVLEIDTIVTSLLVMHVKYCYFYQYFKTINYVR